MVSVWTILIASACIVAVVINVPAYVLVKSQLESYLQEYNQATLETESFKESEKDVVQSNELATLLMKSDATQFSEEMLHLDAQTKNGVHIMQFVFERDTIIVTGRADSREALSVFQKTLEADPRFTSATLPLSNLAKDRDIPFSITLIPDNSKEQ